MGPHKELLSATAASGGAQQPSWQSDCFQGTVCFPRVAPGCLLPVQLRWLWAQPHWLVFLAAFWVALGEGSGLSLSPCSGCEAQCGSPDDEDGS